MPPHVYLQMTYLGKSRREIFKCPLCPATFFRRFNLKRHIRAAHEKERNYPCSFCDRRFSNASNLKVHVEMKHSENEEFHHCDKCEYKSHSKHNLAQHVRNHHPLDCYFCKRRFHKFDSFVFHYGKMHTKEKQDLSLDKLVCFEI